MYYEGGFYFDIDNLYNIPLNQIIIENQTKMLLPIYKGSKVVDFAQSFMCSAANNSFSIIKALIFKTQTSTNNSSIVQKCIKSGFGSCTKGC